MNEPRIFVDFNEMPSEHEVLLSQDDSKTDSSGKVVLFIEGMRLAVYMDDRDADGKPDNLIAEGVALRNYHGNWTVAGRWLLRIDERGIRHESEELSAKRDGV